MKKTLTGVIKSAIVILIFLFIFAFIQRHIHELAGVDLHFRLQDLCLSLILYAIFSINLALLWVYITKKNHCQIPMGRSLIYWYLSEAGKYIPSKLLLFIGRIHFYNLENRPLAPVTFSLYLEIICGLLASIFVFLIAALLVPAEIFQPFQPYVFLLLALLLAFGHPRLLEYALVPLCRMLKKEPLRLNVTYLEILEITGLYALNIGLLGLAFFFTVRSIYDIPASTILYMAAANALAGVAGGAALFAPSGLGVREGILTLTLSAIMPAPLAGIAALVARICSSGTELALIAVSLILARWKRIKI